MASTTSGPNGEVINVNQINVWAVVPSAVGSGREDIAVASVTLVNTINSVAQYSVTGVYKDYTIASKKSLSTYDKDSTSFDVAPASMVQRIGLLQKYLHNREDLFAADGSAQYDCAIRIDILNPDGVKLDSIHVPALLSSATLSTFNGQAAIQFNMSHPIAALDVFNGAVYNETDLLNQYLYKSEEITKKLSDSYKTEQGQSVAGRINNVIDTLVASFDKYKADIYKEESEKNSRSVKIAFRLPLHAANKSALVSVSNFLTNSIEASSLEELKFDIDGIDVEDTSIYKLNTSISLFIANAIVSSGSLLSTIINNILPQMGCNFVCSWPSTGSNASIANNNSLYGAQIVPREVAYEDTNIIEVSDPVSSFTLSTRSNILLPPKRVIIASNTLSKFFDPTTGNSEVYTEGKFNEAVWPPFENGEPLIKHKTEIARGPVWLQHIDSNAYDVKVTSDNTDAARSSDIKPLKTVKKEMEDLKTNKDSVNVVENILKGWAKRLYYERNLKNLTATIVVPLNFKYEVNKVYNFSILQNEDGSKPKAVNLVKGFLESIQHSVDIGGTAKTSLTFSFVRLNGFELDEPTTKVTLSSKPLSGAEFGDPTEVVTENVGLNIDNIPLNLGQLLA